MLDNIQTIIIAGIKANTEGMRLKSLVILVITLGSDAVHTFTILDPLADASDRIFLLQMEFVQVRKDITIQMSSSYSSDASINAITGTATGFKY